MPIPDADEPSVVRPLPEHVARVWWAGPDDAHDGLLRLLDPVERARHAATAAPANRREFLLGCAISRVVLGALLGMEPARVPLVRRCPVCGGPHGKVRLRRNGPRSDGPGDGSGSAHSGDGSVPVGPRDGDLADIRFSVTHGGGLVGVAFHRGGDTGLDVEPVDPALRVAQVAPGMLAPRELAQLDQVAPGGRLRAFLRYWCRKEAAAKAVGAGLRTRFRDLEVTPPGLPAAVTAWPDRPDAMGTVRLADLEVGDAHQACLAVLAATAPAIEQYRAGALLRHWAGS
ncbi:4'-phosphopantetheinyl transferase family protein [Streptomyces sp. NPDC018031]|uniref:4'-phosphopantetheinyl transferase family protein n=1 Tax=Streptomyces sp. NPDC018031 TaxID=3365033 RepID=UPI0037BE1D05